MCYPAAPMMGRNFQTPVGLRAKVKNIYRKSAPNNLCFVVLFFMESQLMHIPNIKWRCEGRNQKIVCSKVVCSYLLQSDQVVDDFLLHSGQGKESSSTDSCFPLVSRAVSSRSQQEQFTGLTISLLKSICTRNSLVRNSGVGVRGSCKDPRFSTTVIAPLV